METTGLHVIIFGQGNLEAMKPETKDSWTIMHEDDVLYLGTLPQAFNHSELNLFPYVFHLFTFKIKKIIGSESHLMSGDSVILFIVISAQ